MKEKTQIGKFLIFTLLFCLLGTACFSQNTNDDMKPAQSIEELKQQLEKTLEDAHIPGMSVAVVRRDGQDWVAGLGKADVASDRMATSETRFRIGSTSKGFVSLAVLMLVEQGKLSLEDPVHKLAPEVWFENRWEASDPVRIVHLLEHTTGWDDMHLREYAKDDATINLLEALDYDHHSRISRWRPGTRMAYCNAGPSVAAYIVEKVTGMRFEDYVRENLFTPIGMQTATYFQPTQEFSTTYQADGKTAYPYSNIIHRPSGAINACASDMANYLRFYLNRGNVNGTQILPTTAINRMEIPTSTWAAKEGLKVGYGLSNYWTIHDGFVYHGHNGGIDGGLTEMAYMPDLGVGYFYSINSANGEAFNKIGAIIRSYITRDLQKPSLPPTAPLPINATEYAGWYEPDSPRLELTSFLERLLGMTYIRFEESRLLMSSLGEKNATFLPVTGAQFRYVPVKESPEPVATVELLNPNVKGKFIQMGLEMTTMKRIPTWLAIAKIVLTGFVLLSIISILLYAPFWILGGIIKKWRRPRERSMRLLPLVAVLSLVSIVVICALSGNLFILRMGNLTGWSLSLFLATIIFAVASVASAVVLWRTPKQEVRRFIRVYSIGVSTALVIATGYLAYWGVIGLRIWA